MAPAAGSRKSSAEDAQLLILVARIDERVGGLQTELGELRKSVVTKDEFDAKFTPVRLIAYGLVAVMLTSLLLAVIGGVFESRDANGSSLPLPVVSPSPPIEGALGVGTTLLPFEPPPPEPEPSPAPAPVVLVSHRTPATAFPTASPSPSPSPGPERQGIIERLACGVVILLGVKC